MWLDQIIVSTLLQVIMTDTSQEVQLLLMNDPLAKRLHHTAAAAGSFLATCRSSFEYRLQMMRVVPAWQSAPVLHDTAAADPPEPPWVGAAKPSMQGEDVTMTTGPANALPPAYD